MGVEPRRWKEFVLDIAERSKTPFYAIEKAARLLSANGLLFPNEIDACYANDAESRKSGQFRSFKEIDDTVNRQEMGKAGSSWRIPPAASGV